MYQCFPSNTQIVYLYTTQNRKKMKEKPRYPLSHQLYSGRVSWGPRACRNTLDKSFTAWGPEFQSEEFRWQPATPRMSAGSYENALHSSSVKPSQELKLHYISYFRVLKKNTKGKQMMFLLRIQ